MRLGVFSCMYPSQGAVVDSALQNEVSFFGIQSPELSGWVPRPDLSSGYSRIGGYQAACCYHCTFLDLRNTCGTRMCLVTIAITVKEVVAMKAMMTLLAMTFMNTDDDSSISNAETSDSFFGSHDMSNTRIYIAIWHEAAMPNEIPLSQRDY